MKKLTDVVTKNARQLVCQYMLIMACGLLFPITGWAIGLEVDPGEIYIENVALGEKVAVSSLGGERMKLRIKNKSASAYTYTINVLSTAETTATLEENYVDIPDVSWIEPESKEVKIAGNSAQEVELYLNMPKKTEYYNKKYQAVIEVKSKKRRPEELFVLACQFKIHFSTYASEEEQRQGKYPRSITIVKTKDKWQENPKTMYWLRTAFPYSQIRELDYSTKEGKKSVEELKIDFLPAYIFSEDVERSKRLSSLTKSGSLRQGLGGRYLWSGGAQNGVFIKRKREPHTLEIFSASRNSESRQLVDKIIVASKESRIPKNFQLKILYFASAVEPPQTVLYPGEVASPDFIKSVQLEREEDIRQLCVRKYALPGAFLDYLLLRNKDMEGGDWKAAAVGAGVDAQVISNCVLNEGEALLKEEIKKSRELELSTQPALLYENRILILDPSLLKELPGLEKLEIEGLDRCG